MSTHAKKYKLCHAIIVMAYNLGMLEVLKHRSNAIYSLWQVRIVYDYLLSRPVSLDALTTL